MPKYASRAQLGYRFSNNVTAQVNVEGASGYPIDFTNPLGADNYVIWGLEANGAFVRGISWFVEGRNLSTGAMRRPLA